VKRFFSSNFYPSTPRLFFKPERGADFFFGLGEKNSRR